MATIPSAHFTVLPLFMQSGVGETPLNYTAADFRRLTTATFLSQGIVTPTAFHVEQNTTPGWSIRIRTGIAVVGDYLVTNTETLTMNVNALNTNPIGTRYHRVYLLVQDKLKTGDGYYAYIKVVEDFGAGATQPDADAGILLATFTISPGQTNITDDNISAKPRNASHGTEMLNLDTSGILQTGVISADAVSDYAPPRVRYAAGRVWFSGAVKKSSGVFPTGATTLGTLPFYLCPLYKVSPIAACSGATHWRLDITAGGVMSANIPDGSTPTYLNLDGVSYEVD